MKRCIKSCRLILGFIFLLLVILPATAFAGLSLEGQLQSAGARTATTEDKNVTLILKVYDDEFSGRLLYAEEQKVTSETKFSLNLGRGQTLEGKPETGLAPDKLWLEVSVGDAVMSPRLNLAELETRSDLRSDAGWTMARAGLRGAGNSTLTIDNDGITLDEVKVPLLVSGAVADNGVIQATNSEGGGHGVYGEATGLSGFGVHGEATGLSGFGVHGLATGSGGCGVFGKASDNGRGNNFGGFFTADATLGYGVYGRASATGNATNYGGYFMAQGDTGYGVYGRASATGNVINYGGYFEAKGDTGRGVYGEATGISGLGVYGKATGSNGNAIYGYASGSIGNGIYGVTTGNSGHGVHGYATATGNVTNYGGYFKAKGDFGRGVYGEATGTNGIGVQGNGTNFNFYASGSGDSADYGTFTGAHDVRLAVNANDLIQPGMIVVCTGRVAVREENGKPCLSSTMPTITMATKTADKKIFGVLIKECPLPKDHWYEAEDDERFGIVNALGEGLVWVCDINGKIEAGDYITSSTVAGYGQLQNDDVIHSYTLGKATADVDWKNITKTVDYNGRKVKIYLIPVVYTSG